MKHGWDQDDDGLSAALAAPSPAPGLPSPAAAPPTALDWTDSLAGGGQPVDATRPAAAAGWDPVGAGALPTPDPFPLATDAPPARCCCPLCTGQLAYDDTGGLVPGPQAIVPALDPNYIQALVSGSSWASQGQAVTLTYSFLTSAPAYWSGYEDSSTFSAFNEAQKSAARNALAEWSDVARITFQEVSGTGQIAFSNNVQSGSAGYAYYPSQWSQIGGDVFIASNLSYNLNPTLTNYGYLVLEHEIGHAIGLKHPGNYGGGSDAPYLDTAHDTNQYSVMSYYRHAGSGMSSIYPISAMLYDIAAIQYLYGANYNTRSGNTTYSWTNNERFLETIWDGGGNDTIDASNQTSAVQIDLRPGAFSTIGSGNTQNLAIALANTGTNFIENAKGGSAADTLDGNDGANRLEGNGGDDSLNGGLGNDTLVGGGGNDRLDGGTGSDTAVYSGTSASYQVTTGADYTTVTQSGGDGADTLYGVEYLQFSDQTVTIGGGGGGGGGGGSAGTVSISGGSLSEGDSGSAQLHFTVTLSAAAATSTVVTYATANGSAQAGSDYQSKSGAVTIAAGATTAGIDIAVYGDRIAEDDETFTVTLTGVSGGGGATLGSPAAATGTIIDNDQPLVSVAATTASEGAAGHAGQLAFPVTLSLAAATPTTITYRTVDGSAHAGQDFQGTSSGSVVIPAGATTGSIIIPLIGDALYEDQEQLTLELTQVSGGNGAAMGSSTSAIGTIVDDDSVLVTIADATVVEGQGASATLVVSLNATRSVATTVTYHTQGGSAVSGSDFQAVASGSLTIPGGALSGTVTIPILNDSVVEPSQTFSVVLDGASGGSGVALGQHATATVTIADDDHVSLSLSGGSAAEPATGQSNATFTVSLSAPSATDTVVTYRTSDGTARAGSDYVAIAQGQVTIPAGETSHGITVPVLSDTLVEGDETFTLTLTNSSNPAIAVEPGQSSATLTILDEDRATVSIAGVTATEGDSSVHTVGLTISLTRPATAPVVVAYQTVAGSAEAGRDFVAASGQVTIASGATSAPLNIGILGDHIVEGDETFAVELTSIQGSAGVTLATIHSATVTIDEDDSATVRIAPTTIGEGNDGSTAASFQLTLTNPATSPTIIHYKTVAISAEAGQDFVAVPDGTITIGGGGTAATIPIFVQGDRLIEGDETFAVVLTGIEAAPGVTLATPASATATILNDDAGTAPPTDGLDLSVGPGTPVVVGSTGDDHVSAGTSSATLVGGDGSDVLEGGAGADLLFGDLVGNGDDSVRGGGEGDTLYGGGGADTLAGGTGDDLLLGEGGNDVLGGDEGSDMLFGGGGTDYLRGGDGNDTLFGDEGRDSLDGGSGDDRVYVDANDAFAIGGTGNDVLVLPGSGIAAIDLSADLNQNLAATGPVVQGFEGIDASLASTGVRLTGTEAGNLLIGGSHDDTIAGAGGADTLIGNGGTDVIDGAGGNDRLIWMGGNDTLTGGTGNDVFEFGAGPAGDRPRIADFSPADDTIALAAGYGLTPASALAHLSQHGADTWLSLPGGATVTLVGIAPGSFTAADFQIV